MTKILAKWLMILLFSYQPLLKANDRYFDVNTWYLGVSVGIGAMENPLFEQKDIPLYVLPDIRFYGEKISIENLSVSYSLVEKKDFVFEIIGEQNQDGTFFPGSLRKSYAALIGPFQSSTLTLEPADEGPKTPSARSMSYMSGVELRYYNWLNTFVTLSSDISNVHGGNQLRIEFQKDFSIGQLQLSSSIKWSYKDKRLAGYYYSFDERDSINERDHYYANAATNAHFQINAAYPINQNLAIVAGLSRNWLDETVTNSPIVVKGKVSASFLGAKYVF